MPEDDSLKDFLRDVIEDHDAGASSVESPTLPSPQAKQGLGALPGHAVESLIAQGGMGAVYLARQQALEREVAVKVMTADAESPEMAARFRREALVLGKLAHPNIVPIYDIGTDDEGQLFYTMKLVKGRTLQHILNDLREQIAETVRTHTLASLLTVFRKVCDALAFAHSQGVIHRDLKPENVMVGEFGEVLVMDWGLAKVVEKSDQSSVSSDQSEHASAANTDHGSPITDYSPLHTLQGSVLGTPQYMSPEQAMGKIKELDERSDVFSLGGILYAILTLRAPVEGATLEEVLKKVTSAQITELIVGQAPRLPSSPAGGAPALQHLPAGRIPPALAAVTMKALRLDKAQRYQSVAELSADIEAYQGGFATKAEHAGLAKQLVLLIRRNKGIFSTTAAAWLLITALGVWFVINLRAKERRAVAGEEAAKASETVAVQEKEAAHQSSARANLALADAALREGNGAGMQAALNDVPEDLRDSTWSYLLGQSDTSIARIRTGTDEIDGMAVDPRRPGIFAVADRLGMVTLTEVRTGARLLEFKAGFRDKLQGSQMNLAFSRDGERIAIGRANHGGGIVIHSARDGKKLGEWAAPTARSLEFSPDGGLLLHRSAVNNGHSFLVVWDAATGRLRWRYEPATGHGFGGFTPDGQQVLTVGAPDGLRLVNAQDGTLVRRILEAQVADRRAGVGVSAMALGGADLVALGDAERKVTVVDWRQGRVVAMFAQKTSESAPIAHLAWTPDGGGIIVAVLAAGGRQSIRVWNPRTGSELRSLLGGQGLLRSVAVHPLSGELVVGGPQARVWSLSGAPPKWSLPPVYDGAFAFWGADDLIVAAAQGFRAAAQKLQPGGSTVLWKPADASYRDVSVSADGRWAALCDATKPDSPVLLLTQSDGAIEQVATIKAAVRAARVRFSPSGDQMIVLDRDFTAKVEWLSTATGKRHGELEGTDLTRINDLCWLEGEHLIGLVTANAKRLEPDSEERVALWDAATGRLLRTVMNRTAMDFLAAAPDGSRFAEAGEDKMVRIRDGATLAVLREFRAHDGAITSLAWHPSRSILATASTDLTIRLWNLDTGRLLEELRAATTPFHQLAFSPGGRRLGAVSGSGATAIGQACIWEPESLNEQPANSR